MKKNLQLLRREETSEEGFTLVELMIVVVIIGILAAIAIPIFAEQQKQAIIAAVKSDTKNNIVATYDYIGNKPLNATFESHSDTGVVTDGSSPRIIQTSNNVVSIKGSVSNFKVIVKNEGRNMGCTYTSTTGLTVCSDWV